MFDKFILGYAYGNSDQEYHCDNKYLTVNDREIIVDTHNDKRRDIANGRATRHGKVYGPAADMHQVVSLVKLLCFFRNFLKGRCSKAGAVSTKVQRPIREYGRKKYG